MAQSIVRGNTITLNAVFSSSSNALTDPDDDPTITILDADGEEVATDTASTRLSLGRYSYDYAVPADAELGAWAIRWTAAIDTVGVEAEDGFTVLRESGSGPSIGFIEAFQHAHQTCTPWASSGDVIALYPEYPGDLSILDEACAVASDVLYELTARRWPGRCHDKIRPTAQWRVEPGPPRWWQQGIGQRGGWGFCSCNRGRDTGCASLPEIRLPGNPVDPNSIRVTLNGATFTDFALHDRRFLVRTDGDGWPCCQNLLKPLTEDSTWGVEYDHGMNPPPGGRVAARTYGYELALLMDPANSSDKCTLPKRVTQVTRQGTTVAVAIDKMDLIKDGLIGLSVVDQWVASTNLGRSRRSATVLVPGQRRSARRIS